MSHPVNVATMLARAAALHGARPALRHGDRRITYRELDELTAGSAPRCCAAGSCGRPRRAVHAQRARAHDRGARREGRRARGGPDQREARRRGARRDPRGLRCQGARPRRTRRTCPGSQVVVAKGAEFDALLGAGDPGHRPVDVPGDDLAWLFYTSGTTGRPKGRGAHAPQPHGHDVGAPRGRLRVHPRGRRPARRGCRRTPTARCCAGRCATTSPRCPRSRRPPVRRRSRTPRSGRDRGSSRCRAPGRRCA